MKKNVYFYIFSSIQQGKNPTQISKELNLTKQNLNRYIQNLKRKGFIQKIGYGTWRILKSFDQKEVNILSSDRVERSKHFSPDSIRGHAFMFRLQINSKTRNWYQKEKFLIKNKIAYKPYYVGGHKRGQQIIFKDWKVQLTNSSIIFQTKKSFLSDTTKDSKSYAVYEFLSRVKALENILHANLSISGTYRFKVCRQHYSLIKNALAKQYNSEGKKLKVYTENGLWFIIDNSYNLNEAEGVHSKTADSDVRKVQEWFNGLKKYEGFTPEFLMKGFSGIISNQLIFDSNMKSHIDAVQKLGKGVANFNEQIKNFNVIIEKALKKRKDYK
jgi:hypothetical protein